MIEYTLLRQFWKIYFRMIPFHIWVDLSSPVKSDQTAPCMPFIPQVMDAYKYY